MAKQFDLFLITKFINALDGEKDSFPHKPIFDEIKRDLENIRSHKIPEDKLHQLRETLYKVDEMLLECLTEARKRKEPGKTLMRCYTAAQRMDVCNLKKSNVKKNLLQWRDAIHQIRETVETAPISPPKDGDNTPKSKEVEWTSSVFDETKIYGWEKVVKQISEDLQREGERLNTVGIVGMFGSGKTKLAQKVFASEEVLDNFSLRLWVWVSDCSPERLLRRMLDNLGVEEEEIDSALKVDPKLNAVGVLLFLLHLQLLDKRYLIVFDDVRTLNFWYCNLHVQAPADREWDRLAHGLPKGRGGAIIVTSRSEDDARKMVGRGYIHTPTPLLGDNDGWKLFEEEYVAAGKTVSPKLKEMKDMIMRKCAGLPFALKVAAREMPPPKEEEEKKPVDDGKEKGEKPLSPPGEKKEKEAEETPRHEEEQKHADDEVEKDKETLHPPEEKKDKETVQKKEEKSADDKKEKGEEPSPPLDDKKDEDAMKKETSPHEIREEKPKEDEKEKGKEPPSPLEEKKDKEAMQKETPAHEIQEEKPTGDEKEKGKEPVAEKKDSE